MSKRLSNSLSNVMNIRSIKIHKNFIAHEKSAITAKTLHSIKTFLTLEGSQ